MNFFKRLFSKEPKAPPSPEMLAAADEIFAKIDAQLKPASIAKVGGQPKEDPLSSCFGGRAVALPSEPIPEYNGQKMFPILQVNCSELPYVPDELQGVALFVVWIAEDFMQAFASDHYGEGFVIREYASLDGLASVPDIKKPKSLKTVAVEWSLVTDNAPCWEDAWEITDLSPLKHLDESYEWGEPYDEKYHNYDCTKIGPYPAPLQSSLSETEAKGQFVFQISSEESANWNWVDAGIAYFFKSESGKWEWDCQFC